MQATTNMKGQLAVSKAELRAFELGYIPSRPLYDCRYDLIIDKNGKLLRLQVKYADGKPSNSSGSIIVKLEYQDRKKRIYTYDNSEIDGLVVYIPRLDRLCFLPKSIFLHKRKLSIRITKSKNNQKKKIIAANDYYW